MSVVSLEVSFWLSLTRCLWMSFLVVSMVIYVSQFKLRISWFSEVRKEGLIVCEEIEDVILL
jgi:hypothetical protein